MNQKSSLPKVPQVVSQVLMAACLIVSVPIAIIYNFFVARFVTDITRDAIK